RLLVPALAGDRRAHAVHPALFPAAAAGYGPRVDLHAAPALLLGDAGDARLRGPRLRDKRRAPRRRLPRSPRLGRAAGHGGARSAEAARPRPGRLLRGLLREGPRGPAGPAQRRPPAP